MSICSFAVQLNINLIRTRWNNCHPYDALVHHLICVVFCASTLFPFKLIFLLRHFVEMICWSKSVCRSYFRWFIWLQRNNCNGNLCGNNFWFESSIEENRTQSKHFSEQRAGFRATQRIQLVLKTYYALFHTLFIFSLFLSFSPVKVDWFSSQIWSTWSVNSKLHHVPDEKYWLADHRLSLITNRSYHACPFWRVAGCSSNISICHRDYFSPSWGWLSQ